MHYQPQLARYFNDCDVPFLPTENIISEANCEANLLYSRLNCEASLGTLSTSWSLSTSSRSDWISSPFTTEEVFFGGGNKNFVSPVKDRENYGLIKNLCIKIESLEKSVLSTQNENNRLLNTLNNFVHDINQAIHLVVKNQEKTTQDCLSGIAYISQKSNTMSDQLNMIEKAISETNHMVSKLKIPPHVNIKSENKSWSFKS